MSERRKVAIIGAGIGGVCAAIALRRVGKEAIVFEQASELSEVGAGLSLWPNAIKVLDRLGVGAEVRKIGATAQTMGLRSQTGKVLVKFRGSDYEERFDAPLVVVHRAELMEVLLAALSDGPVRLGMRCTGFNQSQRGATAIFEDGYQEVCDLVVGADGLNSVVRGQLWGKNKPPRYAGYTCWRGVARFDASSLMAGEIVGCGRRFGFFPLTQGRAYWYAVENAPEGASDADGGAKQKLLSMYRTDWPGEVSQLIDATDESQIQRRDLYDRDPLDEWSQYRVTLLGDAAHPSTPNLGQGACMAIEDALVLAESLAEAERISLGLMEYESRRAPRTSRVIKASRRLGELMQAESGWKRRVRDTTMSLIPAGFHLQRMAWLLGHEV